MRYKLFLSLLICSMSAPMGLADADPYQYQSIDPYYFDDEVVTAPGTIMEMPVVQEKKTGLIVQTHKPQDRSENDLSRIISKSNSDIDNTGVFFDRRVYRGMMSCDAECPIDPDEIRNTLVHINALDGVTFIDLVRGVMPVNWVIHVDGVNPKRLIEEYAFVTTDTRERSLNAIQKASDLKFKFIYDNKNTNGAHAPILVVYAGDSGI